MRRAVRIADKLYEESVREPTANQASYIYGFCHFFTRRAQSALRECFEIAFCHTVRAAHNGGLPARLHLLQVQANGVRDGW